MENLLYDYHLDLTTWVYLSSLLVLTVFFKFSPLFRVRNLDMLALVAIAPGLILVQTPGYQAAGYLWLFIVGLVFLVRLLCDQLIVRRPLLEPNLNAGGMTFLGAALLVFISGHVATDGVGRAAAMQNDEPGQLEGRAPPVGHPLLVWFETARRNAAGPPPEVELPETGVVVELPPVEVVARVLSIIALIAVLAGLFTVGAVHFGNAYTGLSVATLFLLLPATAFGADRLDQLLPAALLVWAVVAYREPTVAGLLLGLAGAAIYYPIFLIPLWCGFYWPRGLGRFLIGCSLSLGIAAIATVLTLGSDYAFAGLVQTFGWGGRSMVETVGLWGTVFEPAYRLPFTVAFVALCVTFVLWPVEKNLGTLVSCSAAIMLASQFWHPTGGGLYLIWYVPLLLLTAFRPNLKDRVALTITDYRWRKARANAA
jgi:hypothetical protein